MNIRKATSDDQPKLVELKKKLTHEVAASNGLVGAELKDDWFGDFYASLIDWPNARLVLALSENQSATVGMGLARVLEDKRNVPPCYGQIDDLYLEPAFRSEANYKALVGSLLPFFEDFEVKKIIWYVSSENQNKMACATSVGFQPNSIVYSLSV